MERINRLTVLDSLRGIAAVCVAFFWHYQHFQPQNGFPFSWLAYWPYHWGWLSVDLFFFLSGFVFYYVYKGRIAKKSISLYEYSVNRFSRLYPLHFITLCVVAIFQCIRFLLMNDFFVYQHNDVYHFLLNVFFVQKGWFDYGYSFNAPSWSISSEIVAYFLFFAIIFYFSKGNKYRFYFVGLVFLGLYISKSKLNNLSIPLLNMDRLYISFFMGCLMYEFHKLINISKHRNIILIILSVVLATVVSVGSIFGNKAFGDAYLAVYAILIFPLVVILSLNIKIINKLLVIRPLSYLGEISYSIYLWHFPVQLLIKTFNDTLFLNIDFSSKKVFLGYALITLLISILSFHFLERPTQKYLRSKLL